MLEPDTAKLACQGTDPSSAAEPPTIRLRDVEERPSKSWILAARDKDGGRNARDDLERLFLLNDLPEVCPHLQFKGFTGLELPLPAPGPEQLILQRNLLEVVPIF